MPLNPLRCLRMNRSLTLCHRPITFQCKNSLIKSFYLCMIAIIFLISSYPFTHDHITNNYYLSISGSTMAAESKPAYKSGIDYDEDNVFSKIIAGQIPCYKIFENDDVIAILDAFPSAKGHSLLISKVRKSTILDFTESEAANYLKYLPKLSQIVKDATGCSAVNVISNNGYDAGQRVFHVHFHVIPRNKDDNLFKNPTPSKEMISKDAATEILSKMGVK